ncbi:hypothetical protein ACFVZH_33695 [Streptomyces sp. NPDC059534]|uniref:hypothetical protein n=1 Tax=Streptomyces sp. NPDC059534 TaxID=3346859 RepID=UPI00368A8516
MASEVGDQDLPVRADGRAGLRDGPVRQRADGLQGGRVQDRGRPVRADGVRPAAAR